MRLGEEKRSRAKKKTLIWGEKTCIQVKKSVHSGEKSMHLGGYFKNIF